MKSAKKIYFPLVALLLVLFITLSFVHAFGAGSKSKAGDDFLTNAQAYAKRIDSKRDTGDALSTQNDAQKIRTEIISILGTTNGFGISKAYSSNEKGTDEDGNEVTWTQVRYNSVDNPVITYFEKEYTVTVEKQVEIAKAQDADDLIVAIERKVNNIVVIVPGKKSMSGQSADAILFTAHMDAPKNMPNATGSATLGVMLSQIKQLKDYESQYGTAKYDNDLVFLFTDARYDASFGVHTFMDQFVGFLRAETAEKAEIKSIVDRIQLAINFDSLGNGSSSLLLQTSKQNSKLVSQYARAMGGNLSNSFISDIYKDYASDFQGFEGLNALNLVTFGSNKNNGTALDTTENLSKSYYAKQADMLIRSVQHFGSMDLSNLDSKTDSVYFSFLGLFTIAYPAFVSYILGVLILLLLGAAIFLNTKNKAFSLSALGRGVVIQVLSILATLASMFILFFVTSLILSGFGLFTIQSIVSYVYSNAGIIIGYTLFALAMLALFYNIIRRLFATRDGSTAVGAVSIVRAGAVVFSVIGAVLSFAYPALATMFAIPSVLFMATLLTLTALKKKNEKSSLERMLFYLIPTAIALAIIIPVVSVLGLAVQSVLLPIIMLPLVLLLAVSAPYILMLIKPLSTLLLRLPKRTIRVQRIVTQRIEDKAKPGKFTEVTGKKITTEKINWKYHNGVGMAIIAVIAAVIIMACSALAVPFGSNTYINRAFKASANQYVSSIYDNSLLLVWSWSGVSTESSQTHLQIHDKSAYKYFRYCLEDYEWDMDKNAYTKPVNADFLQTPNIEKHEGTTMRVSTGMFEAKGVMEITLYDAADIKSVSVAATASDEPDYKIQGIGSSTMTIRLSLDDAKYGDEFYLSIEYKTSATPQTIDARISQYIWASESTMTHTSSNVVTSDIKKINDYFLNNYGKDTLGAVRYGIIFKVNKTISL